MINISDSMVKFFGFWKMLDYFKLPVTGWCRLKAVMWILVFQDFKKLTNIARLDNEMLRSEFLGQFLDF